MVPAVTKQEIPHVVQISAQSEQLCERYSKFNWFLKIACLRYEGPWGRDCVSGVRPCLVHSQKLSELIVHFDGGQNPYRTAVRTRRQLSSFAFSAENCALSVKPPQTAERVESRAQVTSKGMQKTPSTCLPHPLRPT